MANLLSLPEPASAPVSTYPEAPRSTQKRPVAAAGRYLPAHIKAEKYHTRTNTHIKRQGDHFRIRNPF